MNTTEKNVDAAGQENVTGEARKVIYRNKVKKNGIVKHMMEPRMKKVSVEMKKMRKERWSLDTGGSSGDEGGRYKQPLKTKYYEEKSFYSQRFLDRKSV